MTNAEQLDESLERTRMTTDVTVPNTVISFTAIPDQLGPEPGDRVRAKCAIHSAEMRAGT